MGPKCDFIIHISEIIFEFGKKENVLQNAVFTIKYHFSNSKRNSNFAL